METLISLQKYRTIVALITHDDGYLEVVGLGECERAEDINDAVNGTNMPTYIILRGSGG